MAATAPTSGKPGRDCPRCPRLVAFRNTWRKNEPEWFNAPVPSFGPADARLLIVGLAPGLRGANRTGRPFTGDYAGDLLYATLKEFGFAQGNYEARPDDGLTLVVVEHNMDLVMQLADRILVIDYGQYLFEGTAAEVQAHAGVIDAYLGGATA